MEEISVTVDGIEYTASYEAFGDEVVTYLPDNTTRTSLIQSGVGAIAMSPETLAGIALRGWANSRKR